MLPPFETERNGGRPGAACGIHAAPVIGAGKCARNGAVCGYHTAPSSTLGGIKLERDGVWFSHCLVGFRNEKNGKEGAQAASPSPRPFPCLLVPLPLPHSHPPHASLLPGCWIRRLHPSRRGEAAVLTRDGRLSTVTWRLGVVDGGGMVGMGVVGCDVASGGCRRR